jgi:hypothetical protein
VKEGRRVKGRREGICISASKWWGGDVRRGGREREREKKKAPEKGNCLWDLTRNKVCDFWLPLQCR